ncbi:MAG: response regulator transcription factor [Chloroflexota bacterium]|nr:response regulator transcription factor [Chloroflexota bacterium]
MTNRTYEKLLRDFYETKAAGLKQEACGYLVKPFTKAEVLAAVECRLRGTGMVHVGDLLLDLRARRVVRRDEEVCLTSLEFDLLAYLVRNAGRVVGYDELWREVWGYADDAGSYELVRMAMSRLRDKIGENAEQPQYIECVRGVGCRLARRG